MASKEKPTITPASPKLISYEDAKKKEKRDEDEVMKACRSGDREGLETALQRINQERDTKDVLNHKTIYEGMTTPLHETCCHGNVDCISLLLKYGADANIYDASGYAPIHLAAQWDNVNAIKVLLEFDPPDINTSNKCTPNQESECRETPLHVACLMGCLRAAMYLVSQEASVSAEDVDGNNLLHFISSSDSLELWKWANQSLSANISSLVNKRNKHDETPAHRAAALGCTTSIKALFRLGADWELKDKQNLTPLDVMKLCLNNNCFIIASGQQQPPADFLSSTADEPQPPNRTMSNDSTASRSPKPIKRRSSITGRDRHQTIVPKGTFVGRRLSNLSMKSSASRTSSIDSMKYLSVSKERLRADSITSEEYILMTLDTARYQPPDDIQTIKPVCHESITTSKSSFTCQDHGIHFSTSYFRDKLKKNESNNKVMYGVSKLKKEEDITVCLAAAMHLNMEFPSEYTIISPITFVSCKCRYPPCSITLSLPHAASIANLQIDRSKFHILSVITEKISVDSPTIESPQPRQLCKVKVESMKLEDRKVTFKTLISCPSLFALGIKNHSSGHVPSPLVPLRCALFCMYKDMRESSIVSQIPVKMYIGLDLKSVNKIMEREAEQSHSKFEEVHFLLREKTVNLKVSLDDKDFWELDNSREQEMNYTQVALTNDTDTDSYSHKLSYPPHKSVLVFPRKSGQEMERVKLEVSLVDSKSDCIGRTAFFPFTPWRSTTVIPNVSPPNSPLVNHLVSTGNSSDTDVSTTPVPASVSLRASVPSTSTSNGPVLAANDVPQVSTSDSNAVDDGMMATTTSITAIQPTPTTPTPHENLNHNDLQVSGTISTTSPPSSSISLSLRSEISAANDKVQDSGETPSTANSQSSPTSVVSPGNSASSSSGDMQVIRAISSASPVISSHNRSPAEQVHPASSDSRSQNGHLNHRTTSETIV